MESKVDNKGGKYLNWNEDLTEEDKSFYIDQDVNKEDFGSNPYKFDEHLNSKIYLINKNILSLEYDCLNIDALVLQTNKSIKKPPSEYRQNILKECGSKVLDELGKYDNLSLCECIVTGSHSFNLFKQIIHVALPKYSIKYQNACESSLHLAVRNIFDKCLEKNVRSLCFGYEIIQPSKSFPIISAITVVCRTVRKCLQKFGHRIDKLAFVVDDKDLFNKFRDTFRMYFPRNKQEEVFYAKFLPNIQETEYGDIILPERQIQVKTDFEKNVKCIHIGEIISDKKIVENFYIAQEDDIKNYKIYRNDEQRIVESVINSNDFAKQFYFEKTKLLTENMITFFDKINFIQYKGTDIMKRQIFFVYLHMIDCYEVDNDHLIDPFIIYLTHYLKRNLTSYNRVSIIIFCSEVQKRNYPTTTLAKTLSKILSSPSIRSFTDIQTHQIIFFLPSLFFKIYLYFLRLYIDNSIWNIIEFYESFSNLNENFHLDLSEEFLKEMKLKYTLTGFKNE